jgi:general secretion pathway protein F
MKRLADYMTRSAAIRDAIISALVYPTILLVSACVSIVVILFFVLPEFEPLFADAGEKMPLAARIAMGIGDIARAYWWLFVLVAAGATVWFRRAMRQNAFRTGVHARLMRLPVLGELLRSLEIERFMRSAGTSLEIGVALPTALTLAHDVLWLAPIADAVAATAVSLREGESLSLKLEETGVFPASALDLVRVGEETGKLDEMLLRQADFDEQRIRHRVDRLLAMLVPMLTIVLGLVIAGLIASMLSAILSVNDLAMQ